jgi:hypothetical protein
MPHARASRGSTRRAASRLAEGRRRQYPCEPTCCRRALRDPRSGRATSLNDRAADRRRRPTFWAEADVTRRLQRREDRREVVGDAPGRAHSQRSQQRQMVLWHEAPPVFGARGFSPAAGRRPVTKCDRILRQLIGVPAAPPPRGNCLISAFGRPAPPASSGPGTRLSPRKLRCWRPRPQARPISAAQPPVEARRAGVRAPTSTAEQSPQATCARQQHPSVPQPSPRRSSGRRPTDSRQTRFVATRSRSACPSARG